ncbi:MAG TPA: hypothetical protein VGF92_08635 [Stellaceae bacterium]
MRRSAKLAVIASLAALPFIGGMAAPTSAQTGAPPALQAEPMPPPPAAAPGAYWVWQPGYWRWAPRQGRYVWAPGRYVHAPYAQAVWEPGNWVLIRGRWVWRAGHWRR